MSELNKKFKKLSEQIKNVKIYNSAQLSNRVELKANIKTVAKYSGELKLPLKIKGELLREGNYYTGQITEQELKKAFNKLANDTKELLIFTTHDAYWGETSNINDIVGKLSNFSWNSSNKSIEFDGDIFDESTALKVANGLVKGISAGFTFENVNGLNKDIEISEGSLTFKPHCKTALVSPAV